MIPPRAQQLEKNENIVRNLEGEAGVMVESGRCHLIRR
jgi:hypothetical protein